MLIADLNGDGKPDLLGTCVNLNCGGEAVGVLLNNSVSAPSPTSTKLVSSLNPSLVGQAVTFTATVSSSAGTPRSGVTITFKNGSAVLGTAMLSEWDGLANDFFAGGGHLQHHS